MRANRNYFTQEGAEELARRVERYWRDRGYRVRAWTERVGTFEPLLRTSGWYVVRSDLVNGWPRR